MLRDFELDGIIKDNKDALNSLMKSQVFIDNIEILNLNDIYTYWDRVFSNNHKPLTCLLLKAIPDFIDKVKDWYCDTLENRLYYFKNTIEGINPHILDPVSQQHVYDIIDRCIASTQDLTENILENYSMTVSDKVFKWLYYNDYIEYDEMEELAQKEFDNLVASGKASYYNSNKIEEILPIIFDNKDYVIKQGKYTYIFNKDNTLKRFSTLQEAKDYVRENDIQNAYILR